MEKTRLPGCALLASGYGVRFGQDKLLYPLNGVPLMRHACLIVPRALFCRRVAVVRTDRAMEIAVGAGWEPVRNEDRTGDIAATIRLGILGMPEDAPGCMFMVADQPWLTSGSIQRLTEAFSAEPDCIHALSFRGQRGNPVIFPRSLFGELASLQPGQSGRAVLTRHPELLRLTEAGSARELADIDTPEDLKT